MSRLPLVWVIVAPLIVPMIAQTPAPQAPPPASPPPAEAAKSDATVAADTPSPVPSAESWLTGSIDVGYRWGTGVGGSLDTYRSIVNLGSGPKVLGGDFALTDPQHRFFDQVHVRASGW